MPAIQSCDPAAYGRAFNTTMQSTMGVGIEVRWNWDGVSPYPNCDGPLVDGTGSQSNRWAVQVTNPTGSTWYVHTTRKNGQPVTYSIAPGVTTSLTAAQASAGGYSVLSDFLDLTLTTTP